MAMGLGCVGLVVGFESLQPPYYLPPTACDYHLYGRTCDRSLQPCDITVPLLDISESVARLRVASVER